MAHRFAYSYDREDFLGSYDTPEAAFDAALEKAETLPSPPTEIYIGKLVDPDPQVTDHAPAIVESMNRRAHVDFGDSAARYLRHLTPEQIKDLDLDLAATLTAWLRRHNLMPTFYRVAQVREFPVPFPNPRRYAPAREDDSSADAVER